MAEPTTPLPDDAGLGRAPERAMLEGFLGCFRAVLARKAEGLADDQARMAPCPPSDLSMLGLAGPGSRLRTTSTPRRRSTRRRPVASRSTACGGSTSTSSNVHLIEGYARHCGHADLIRQAIDGATGD